MRLTVVEDGVNLEPDGRNNGKKALRRKGGRLWREQKRQHISTPHGYARLDRGWPKSGRKSRRFTLKNSLEATFEHPQPLMKLTASLTTFSCPGCEKSDLHGRVLTARAIDTEC